MRYFFILFLFQKLFFGLLRLRKLTFCSFFTFPSETTKGSRPYEDQKTKRGGGGKGKAIEFAKKEIMFSLIIRENTKRRNEVKKEKGNFMIRFYDMMLLT